MNITGSLLFLFDFVCMMHLSIFNLKALFYQTSHPWGQIPRSRILHSGQRMRYLSFLVLDSESNRVVKPIEEIVRECQDSLELYHILGV